MQRDHTPTKPGIYPNIPENIYHSWDALSVTTSIALLKSPGHYKYKADSESSPTPAQRLGSMIHQRILDPGWFFDNHIFVPEHVPRDRRTKGRKLWESEILPAVIDDDPEGSGVHSQTIIESVDAKIIESIHSQVQSCDVARELLCGEGEAELSLFYVASGKSQDIPLKGRLDKYHREAKVLVDIKTTRDASPEAFGNSAANYCYHIQMAHYVTLARMLDLEVEEVIIVAIETSPPFGVIPYVVPHSVLRAGREQFAQLLDIYERACQAGDWPVYEDKIYTLQFPTWGMKSIEKALGRYK